MNGYRYILFFTVLLFAINMNAQIEPSPDNSTTSNQDTTKASFLYVDRADRQLIDASEEEEKLYLWGSVRLTHDSIFMFCDSAVMVNKDLRAKGNISIIKNDSIKIFSDSLLYLGDSLMAYFVGNVVLEKGNQQLYTSFLQYDLEKDWAIYTDTALLVSTNMQVKSKRGIYHVDEQYINFYEKVTIEGDDFDLLSDSLRYYTELDRADFLSPTIINQGDKTIYSEGGYYDIDDKKSLFFGNAQFKEGDNISTADTIKNDDNSERIELIGNANYISLEEEGRGDTIIYRKDIEEFELMGNAFFKNSENEVTGDRILYRKLTDDVRVKGRSFLSNPPMLIYADDLDYQKEAGVAFANGNVIWQDTSSNYEIICDHANYIDSTDYMKAFNDQGKPLLKNEVSEGDTLYLSGDTLISYSKIVELDTFRFFSAFENVELLNSDLQAISDSLMYNGQDSLFTLYGNPFMWSDSSQYNGDTIIIFMADNELEKVDLIDNALILTSEDFQFFDQIKGKRIEAFFESGVIDNMVVTGGSESVYYMKDSEKAYLGVNETKCTNMKFVFEDGNLTETRYYKEPISKLTPMSKANHESIKLAGFNWKINDRPLKIKDLYF
ncbi:MAG: OstA-like protein [Saprospiraceae bacterium]|nr:OstA-like protein [Saprospiraceae bacterium]